MNDMTGRTVLITGASSGIGRATAIALGAAGARLLLAGRTPDRCAAALEAVRVAGGRGAEMLLCDFTSLAGIRKLADDVSERCDHLDVLVNNAGITLTQRLETADGFEMTFAVNHLSYFLLTGLLLPKLQSGTAPRIVSVASDAHQFGRLDLDDLQNEQGYSTMRVYGQSKTANILWNTELARRLEGSGTTANCLHPGAVRSGLGRGNGPLLDFVQRGIGMFLRSPERGAQTSIYLASSPEVAGKSGGYYANSRPKQPRAFATDPASAQRLWEISEKLTGFSYP